MVLLGTHWELEGGTIQGTCKTRYWALDENIEGIIWNTFGNTKFQNTLLVLNPSSPKIRQISINLVFSM